MIQTCNFKKSKNLLILAVFLFVFAALATFPRTFGISKSGSISGIRHLEGNLYVSEVPTNISAYRKPGILPVEHPILLENGEPLAHPGKRRGEIISEGEGGFRVVGRSVLFSSSDNTDPTRNGRIYSLIMPLLQLPEALLLCLWALGLLALIVSLFYQLVPPKHIRRVENAVKTIVTPLLSLSFLIRHPLKVSALAMVSAVVVAVLTFPGEFGLTKDIPITNISDVKGHLYEGELFGASSEFTPRFWLPDDYPILLENSVPLKLPGASPWEIEVGGNGRFYCSKKQIFFSSSDQTPPGSNGKTYQITKAVFQLPEMFLIILWLLVWVFVVVTLVVWVTKFKLWFTKQANFETHLLFLSRPWLHVGLIILVLGFVFYGTNFRYGIRPDCVVALDPAFSTLTNGATVFSALQGRRVLPVSQNNLYHLLGESYQASIAVYASLFGLAAIVLYLGIRKLFTPASSLLAVLFFVSYSGKYETLTWFAAGMYQYVILLATLVLFTLFSRSIKPISASIICGLLIWLSLPVYELLIMLLPIFSIIYIGGALAERRVPKWQEWFASIIPIVPALVHVVILAFAPNPLWNRSSVDGAYHSLPFYHKLMMGWVNSLSQTFGPEHWEALKHGVWSFVKFVAPLHGVMLFFLIVIAGVVFLYPFVFASRRVDVASGTLSKQTKVLFFIVGLYITLFSGTITSVLGPVVPSRMTYLPSLGFALVLAFLLDWSATTSLNRSHRFAIRILRSGIPIAVAVLILCEAVTFASIVKQAEESRVFDDKITEQIQTMFPTLPDDAEVVVCMPIAERSKAGFWWQEPSYYECGIAYSTLWSAYQKNYNTISYHSTARSPLETKAKRYASLVDAIDRISLSRVYPFSIDEKMKVRGIKTVTDRNQDTGASREVRFPTMADLPGDLVTEVKLP